MVLNVTIGVLIWLYSNLLYPCNRFTESRQNASSVSVGVLHERDLATLRRPIARRERASERDRREEREREREREREKERERERGDLSCVAEAGPVLSLCSFLLEGIRAAQYGWYLTHNLRVIREYRYPPPKQVLGKNIAWWLWGVDVERTLHT